MNLNLKQGIVTTVSILALITAIWAFDERYISATELKQSNKQIYIQLDMGKLRELTRQYYDYQKLIQQNPNDRVLEQQFNDIKKEMEETQKRIDQNLRDKN